MSRKEKRFWAILLCCTLALSCVASYFNSMSLYASVDKAYSIQYLGIPLASTDAIAMKSLKEAKKESKGTEVVFGNGTGYLGAGMNGYKQIKSSVSYEELRNLIFNLEYAGITQCKSKLSIESIDASIEDLVKDAIEGKDSALVSNLASRDICPGYDISLSKFDTSVPFSVVDGIRYYGPFQFSDNTLAFAEVTADDGAGVYQSKDGKSFSPVTCIEGSKDYYIGTESVGEFRVNFEGVFFDKELQFYDGAIIPCAKVKNVTVSKTIAVSDVMALNDEVVIDVNESAVNAGEVTATPTPKPNCSFTVNFKDGLTGKAVNVDADFIITGDDTVNHVKLDNKTFLKLTLKKGATIKMAYLNSDVFEMPNWSYTIPSTDTHDTTVTLERFKLSEGFMVQNVETKEGLRVKMRLVGTAYSSEILESSLTDFVYFDDVPAGTYELQINDDGKWKTYGKYNIVGDPEDRNAPGNVVYLDKVQGSTILSLLDFEGNGVAGATVNVGNRDYVSDDRGIVTVDGLAYGEYDYSVTKVPAGYKIGTTGKVTIGNGTNTSVAKIKIPKETFRLSIKKRVKDTAVTVPDAVYTVIDSTGAKTTYNTSDPVLVLEKGTYTIKEVVSGQGYAFSETTTQTVTGESATEEVVFETVGSVGSILVDNYSSFSYKDKIAEVEYTLFNSEGEAVNTVTSDEMGRVLFEGIPSGNYTLQQTAVPDSYQRYTKFVSVTVEGGSLISYDAVLAEKVGSITIFHESPVSGVMYTLYDSEENPVDSLYTNDDGMAIFRGLRMGTYTVKQSLGDGIDSAAGTGVTATPTLDLSSLFSMTVYAYSGSITISPENLNVVAGSEKESTEKTTYYGDSKIVPSSSVKEYDSSYAGVNNYSSINVDGISNSMLTAEEKKDYSSDVDEQDVANVIDVSESFGTDNSDAVGSEYKGTAGTLVLTGDNTSNGDADFVLSTSDVSSMLDKSVKLPKTGLPVNTAVFGWIFVGTALAAALRRRQLLAR